MTANGWFQICFFFVLVLICVKPLGLYMARVFEGDRTFADRIFRPIEKLMLE
jgi:potassium-transporting ATPase potassium-binding subunit